MNFIDIKEGLAAIGFKPIEKKISSYMFVDFKLNDDIDDDTVFIYNGCVDKWFISGMPRIELGSDGASFIIRFAPGFRGIKIEKVFEKARSYMQKMKKLQKTIRLKSIAAL